MRKNIPQLWDEIWQGDSSVEEDRYILSKEENSIRWQRIEKIVLQKFGSFVGRKVIEIGAGIGTYAALMAKKGADVTIVDYSEVALKRAANFFSRNGLSAQFIKHDALTLPMNFFNKYDIAMSFGLAEHFKNQQRILINKIHFDLLRKGGIAFISVPNKWNVPYRLFKFVAEIMGRWKIGEEYPYSRVELKNICQKIGVKQYSFFGDSLYGSFKFINPLQIIKKTSKNSWQLDRIKKEKGTFLDCYFSYALVLYGEKSI
ncbi:MAG: methyltransferase domain-containing protein [candidate division WOR-3 bacterium]